MCILYTHIHVRVHVVCVPQYLISFETWAKLAQKWLVCAALGMHLQPIN